MTSFLNLGSLVLGLIAWLLPVINLMQFKRSNNNNWAVLSFLSISACAISLYFQILYNNYLVEIWDASALMDTTGASAFLSSVLLVVTIVLNIISIIMYFRRTEG
jgi:cytochrome c oxidase subunit 4